MNQLIYTYAGSDELESDADAVIHRGVLHYAAAGGHFGFYKERDLRMPEHVSRLLATRPLAAVVGHFSFGAHRFIPRLCTYITLLRDPVDRIVSLYYHVKHKGSIEHFLTEFRKDGLSLDQSRLLTDNDQTRRISGLDPPFGKCTQATLDQAKHNLREHFSVVGTTDRFDETLALMASTFGWEYRVGYWSKHVNTARPSVSSLAQSTVERIREHNRLDAELYSFARKKMDELILGQGSRFEKALKAVKRRQSEMMAKTRTRKPELAEGMESSMKRLSSDASDLLDRASTKE